MTEITLEPPCETWVASNFSPECVSKVLELAEPSDESLSFVMDWKSGQYIYLKGSPHTLFGVSREELIRDPRAWERSLSAYDRGALVGLGDELEAKRSVVKYVQATGGDGVSRSLRCQSRLVEFEGRTFLCGHTHSIDSHGPEAKEASLIRMTVEGARDGLAITDATGHFVYLNQEHVKIFGYENAAELVGQSWEVLYTPETLEFIKTHVFPELISNKIWRGDLQAKRKDGSLIWEALSLSLLPGGEIVCNCRDITKQVSIAERLKQSEDLLRSFLNSLPTGVMIRQLGGTYEFVNDTARRWFELETMGPLDSCDLEKSLNTNPVFASWTEAYQQALTNGTETTFDSPLFWGGRQWILEVQKNPLFLTENKVSHVCTLMRDVTEQRRLEEQDEETARRSEEYYVMQREFISMVSHEFRTPLSAIKGAHYLLNKKTVGLSELEGDYFRRLLSLQNQAINNLEELVDQVLLLNKLDHAPSDTVLTRVKPAEFFADIVESLNITVARGRIRVKLHLPLDYEAELSPTKIRAAIENLVSNALKYSPADSEVWVTLELATEGWRLSVSDCGRGIPEEDQAKLFLPFHRASNVDGVAGTGLGLAIIQRVAECHRGTVTFTSTEGVGSVFTLNIPNTLRPPSSPVETGITIASIS
jgi:PAS domain S-box-containing protein